MRKTLTRTTIVIGLVCLSCVNAPPTSTSKPAAAADDPSRFDGRWKARYTSSPSAFYDMEFSGGRFHAVSGDQWYKGAIVLDAGTDPARIDFKIEECECGREGKTSEGIFRWDGDTIEIRAPETGNPRPTEFDETSGETMRLVREPAAPVDAGGPTEPLSDEVAKFQGFYWDGETSVP